MRETYANIMAVDTLAPFVAMSSVTMVLDIRRVMPKPATTTTI